MTELLNCMIEAAGGEGATTGRLVGLPVDTAEWTSEEKEVRLAVVQAGLGYKRTLAVIRGLHQRFGRAIVGAHEEDVCTYPFKEPLVRADVIRAVLKDHKGLVVGGPRGGQLISRARKETLPSYDPDDPRLNPIVAAITDGRLPENPTEEDLDQFAKLGSVFDTSKKKRRRFVKSALKAYPITNRRWLW